MLKLGFFTRLLDEAPASERYKLGLEQIVHAERLGYDTAWVAQHHFHEAEGGLPAPTAFLAYAAARTSRIRLATGIITLPLELPLRVAEDTAVLDMLADGRLEVGVGPGGNHSAFTAFGRDPADRATLMTDHLALIKRAWTGGELQGGDRLYPTNPSLVDRVWQATFTVEGGRRAGADGDGLLLSRTQPRPKDNPAATITEIQAPILDAYYAALPPGRAPRVLASRSVFVADDRASALRLAEIGLRRNRARLGLPPGGTLAEWLTAANSHVGTPNDVIDSLAADTTLQRATELAVQVHSIDPPHALTLRSLELVAEQVAPALGWAGPRAVAKAA
ncbi:putative FMN-dependent luciferase-like monooxygenase [Acidisphaera sp. L21]|uniref:putative FMN-dependent luciferase-like monooxygenase n=1 Tax=Acidisphaera sp. L21 TaxID=1641851 RepID=UPI00131C037B|nr:putative FMN-dependent luciferase-like monooxygenase [Acidisphaera sp. L21]